MASLHRYFRSVGVLVFVGMLASSSTRISASPIVAGDFGTVLQVEKSIRMQPWGTTSADAKSFVTDDKTIITLGTKTIPATDVKPGMWIKLDAVSAEGVARAVRVGWFLSQTGEKVVIFQGLPTEFLLADVKDWYTNEAGGVKFKIQLMRGPDKAIVGMNLRPSVYKEPAEGFVFYWPITLKGTVLNVHGAKPGTTAPDAEGKIVITKETVNESYWKHPKNPNKLEEGFVSGLTELTVRKIPKQMP